eukprot:6127359-Amphidinium_carterae.1
MTPLGYGSSQPMNGLRIGQVVFACLYSYDPWNNVNRTILDPNSPGTFPTTGDEFSTVQQGEMCGKWCAPVL